MKHARECKESAPSAVAEMGQTRRVHWAAELYCGWLRYPLPIGLGQPVNPADG